MFEEFKQSDFLEMINIMNSNSPSEESTIKELGDLADKIFNYDVVDFLQRFATLRLLKENQTKGSFLDMLLEMIVFKMSEENYKYSNNKMSPGRFRNIIATLNNISPEMEDPSENLFVEKIYFLNKEYFIFPNNHYEPSSVLNLILKALECYSKSNIECFKDLFCEIEELLCISTKVMKNIEFEYLKDEKELYSKTNTIAIPQSSEILLLEKFITFSKTDFRIFNDDNIFVNNLGLHGIEKVLSDEKYYHTHPFLKSNDKVILLDINAVFLLILHRILSFLERNNILEEFTEFYNNLSFEKILEMLEINSFQIKTKIIVEKNSKTIAYRISNSELCILRFTFQNLYELPKNGLYSHFDYQHSDYLSKLENEITLIGDFEKLYYLDVCNPILSSYTSMLPERKDGVKNKHIFLTYSMLENISILEDKYFLYNYMDFDINIKLHSGLYGEINSIAFFVENNYDCYIDDYTDVNETQIYFNGEYITKYKLEARKIMQYSDIDIEKKYNSRKNIITNNIHDRMTRKANALKHSDTSLSSNGVCNSMVTTLYKEFIDFMRQYNSEEVIKNIYRILEFNMYSIHKNLNNATDIFENEEAINVYMNSIFQDNTAMRFILEYLSSTKNTGTKNLFEKELIYIICLVSEIIKWGNFSDMYRYNLFEDQISNLKSGRISIDDITANTFNSEMLQSRTYDMFFKNNSFSFSEKPYLEEINICFEKEFGFKFDDLESFILLLIKYSEHNTVHIESDELFRYVKSKDSELNSKIIKNMLEFLTLTERDEFLKPDKPFRNFDVLPWRYNRGLSLYRKPILFINNRYIYGKFMLEHNLYYIRKQISEDKFVVETNEFKDLLSKISNDRGKSFNLAVKNQIEEIDIDRRLDVYLNVKKFRKNKIVNKLGNDLGDIDVLAIDKKAGKLFVIECKAFKSSRNAYEISKEFESMFITTEKKKCYLDKHIERVNWVKEHTDIIEEYFKISKIKDVKMMFVVNQHQVSKVKYKRNIEIVAIGELTIELFK